MLDPKRIVLLREEENFRSLVRDSVLNSYKGLFGESIVKALAFYAPPELAATSPQEFHEKLRGVVKDGASTLEFIIMKDLSECLGLQSRKEDEDLQDFIQRARTMIAAGQISNLEGRSKG